MPSAVVANGFADISAIAASTSRNVAVVAERSGRLTLLDLLRQADGLYDTRVIGEGYDAPRHLAIDDARGTLVIADADGLWLARLNNANRDAATPFASAPGEVLGLGVVAGAPTASLAVLDGKPSRTSSRTRSGRHPATRSPTCCRRRRGRPGWRCPPTGGRRCCSPQAVRGRSCNSATSTRAR